MYLKKFPIVFHKGSNYDYHFIIKEFLFKKQFTCLRENTDKCIAFTVPIEKEVTRIDKNGEEITQNIYLTYYSLLIAQNLWQVHYQFLSITFLKEFIELNKCETCGIKYKYCECLLEQTNFKDSLMEYKGLGCNKNYKREFDEKL